jgi:glycosyltransferase involved in cell wall biosynthesis
VTERVSVVIPVRDGARYLGEALDSVAAQTVPPHEVIVVDDGSSDDSAAMAAAHGARVERRPPLGNGPARNRGIEVSSGELIAFLDADDVWLPQKLERQLELLRARPEGDLVFGHVRQFESPELGDRVEEARPGVLITVMLARRTAFDRVGLFDDHLRVELMDWLLRSREAGLVELMVDDVVAMRRIHATNLSREHATRRDYALAIKSALDRRRAGG